MRTLAILAALAFLSVLVPFGGADPAPDHTCSIVVPVIFAPIAENTGVQGIDGCTFDAPAAGTHLRAHVTSSVGPIYDVDIHFYTADKTHVDTQPDLCDTATQNVDQECDMPSATQFGATGPFTLVIDGKYGLLLTVDLYYS
jgi:hypothetical protein